MDDRGFEPASAARTAGIGSATARCHTSDPLRVGRRAWRSPILADWSLDEPTVVGDSVRAASRHPAERHGVGDAPRRVRAASSRRDALMVGRCAVWRGRAWGFRPSDVRVVRCSITHLTTRAGPRGLLVDRETATRARAMFAARPCRFAGDLCHQRFDGKTHSRLSAHRGRQRTASALDSNPGVGVDDIDFGAEPLKNCRGRANAGIPVAARSTTGLISELVADAAQDCVPLVGRQFGQDGIDHRAQCWRVGTRQHHVSIRLKLVHGRRLSSPRRSANSFGANDAISFQRREMATHRVVG